MARRRTLRPEELEIWQAVARTARPLHVLPPSFAKPEPEQPMVFDPVPPPAQPRLSPFRLGEKSRLKVTHDLVPSISHDLAAAPLQMDAKTHGKMTRGKLLPEARLDLHGMTLSEAHPELIHFILSGHSAGLRLVLVITGKGKRGHDTGPIPQRMGALRHQVPHWLRMAPLAQVILQVTEAHLRHGGSGAYYVYLRRR